MQRTECGSCAGEPRLVGGKLFPSASGCQRGSSVVTLVAVLPLLLVLLCGVLDLGRTVFLRMELENAAASVRQGIEEGSLSTVGEDALVSIACAASPSLKASGLDLAAEVKFEEPEEGLYLHWLYDRESGGFAERPSRTRMRRFEVALTIEGSHLTPVGELIVPIDGETKRFEFVARSVGRVDETVEGGGW